MLEIDGSRKSGSGTLIRDVASYSALTGQDVHMVNIRAKREKAGLRAQHLKALQVLAQICQGQLEGGEVGSNEITFRPGKSLAGGEFVWDIGTAGSVTLLASALLPPVIFASAPSTYRIKGGLFQDYAPSAFHFKDVLIPVLKEMGIEVELEINKPGYVPHGGGEILIRVTPLAEKLRAIKHLRQGNVTKVVGAALSSFLKGRKVSDRMAAACERVLKEKDYLPNIAVLYDSSDFPLYQEASIQPGAALAIWAATDTGCLIGADMAGAPRRTAERIGKQTARNLIKDLESGATVDRHLADQLIPYAALAEGWSSYLIPFMTEHIESRLWLARDVLGAVTEMEGNRVRIKGIGLSSTSFQL
jgi:RNA 3'-terminal phosphate cyclase (ATP)